VKVEDENLGPEILYGEFKKALAELKNAKSAGVDNIPGELLKALGNIGKQELYDICKATYAKEEWPKDFAESIIIPIEKKKAAQECVHFRTISFEVCTQHYSQTTGRQI